MWLYLIAKKLNLSVFNVIPLYITIMSDPLVYFVPLG